MISGVDVTLIRPGRASTDRLGNESFGEPIAESVGPVVVADPTTDDMEAARALGASVAFTLHFPKTFQGSLEGCIVQLPAPWDNDGGYRVIGDPRPYMDANTPGAWNRPAMVEAAHG